MPYKIFNVPPSLVPARDRIIYARIIGEVTRFYVKISESFTGARTLIIIHYGATTHQDASNISFVPAGFSPAMPFIKQVT